MQTLTATRRHLLATALIFLGMLFPLWSRAQSKIQGILLNADSSFRDSENDTMELEGHVQIILQTQHIKCDKARVNLRTRQAELIGHVEIASQKSNAGGTSATIDYENNTGVIYDGFVQSGQVAFSGSVLQKVSEDEYYVSTAEYTTCTNCPATWGFSGSNIRAQLGAYAYIKNSFLKIYAVPVFWFPYLIVPLKSDRQSGLLPPRLLGDSDGGVAISDSYFWAISRSADATFGLTNYARRGQKGFGEYRYMLNENSSGTLSAAALVDRVFSNDNRVVDNESPGMKNKEITRWYTKYDHYYEMPGGYIQRAQINVASDLQYPADFPEETLNFGDPAMENRVSLTKNTFANHFSVDASYYVNVLQADPLASNANAVHRMPEIRFSQTNQKIANSQFIYSYNVDYTSFSRAGQGYDNMTPGAVGRTVTDPDGTYNPSLDLLRTGQRVDTTGSIGRPILIGDYLDVFPALSYRETDYQFDAGEDRSNVRRYLRATISAKTSMSRVFAMGEGPKADKYKHEIRPEIIATTIPWMYHPAHPFFGTDDNPDPAYYYNDFMQDADVNGTHGVQFDYNDRVYDRGLVTFVLDNKLIQKKWAGDNPEYLQVLSFKLLQSYDSYQSSLRNPTREPWSDLTAILDMRFPQIQTYSIFTYLQDLKVTNVNARVRLNNEFGQFFQIQWIKTYSRPQPDQTIESVDLEKSRTENYVFGAGFQSGYLNLMGKFTYNANWANTESKDKITSWAYIAQIKPPGDCWAINYTQYLNTGQNIRFSLDFAFNFDGNSRAALPPEALDQYGF